VTGPGLSGRELDRLAVLRVIALAYPGREKVEVFRADVLDLLAVVDRLMAGPRVDTVTVFHDAKGNFQSGSIIADHLGGQQ
jgi:hypothetical protein